MAGQINERNERKRTNERCNLYYENLLWCHIKYIGCYSIVRCTQSVCAHTLHPIAQHYIPCSPYLHVCVACIVHRILYDRTTESGRLSGNTAIHHALLIQFIRFYKYFSVIFIGCVVSLTCVSIARPGQRFASEHSFTHELTHTHTEAEAGSDNTNAKHAPFSAHVRNDENRKE